MIIVSSAPFSSTKHLKNVVQYSGEEIMKTKRILRIKWKNLFLLLLTCLIITGIIVSSIHIIKWKLDSNDTKEQTTNLNKPKEVDTTDEEIIPQDDIDESNPYWDYIKMSLIDVDINELKKTNNDIVGWIQVNGTNINYPFVQTTNNEYYLDHSLNKRKNTAGWVFLDYRNNINTDKNLILYAHSRLDNTMFGTLKNILSSKWVNNTDNFVIKTITENDSSLWQIFSIYHIPTTSDYLQTDFNTNANYSKFLNSIKDRSQYDFNTTVNENDRIITLSTCYNNDTERVVLHAKLIKTRRK